MGNEIPTKSDNQLDKTELRKDAMIKALTKSLGVVTSACKKAGISRDTHYEWLNADENYKNRVVDIKEVAIDFVESKMFQSINNGDTSLVKYFLSTQGKKRGYVERHELTGGDGKDLNVVHIFQIPDNARG